MFLCRSRTSQKSHRSQASHRSESKLKSPEQNGNSAAVKLTSPPNRMGTVSAVRRQSGSPSYSPSNYKPHSPTPSPPRSAKRKQSYSPSPKRKRSRSRQRSYSRSRSPRRRSYSRSRSRSRSRGKKWYDAAWPSYHASCFNFSCAGHRMVLTK